MGTILLIVWTLVLQCVQFHLRFCEMSFVALCILGASASILFKVALPFWLEDRRWYLKEYSKSQYLILLNRQE